MTDEQTPEIAARLLQLLPLESRKALPELYATEGDDDPIVREKLFLPSAGWTWYVIEFDGEDLCFGLVEGFEDELGMFSLAELAELKGLSTFRVERDTSFEAKPLSQIQISGPGTAPEVGPEGPS